jgi:hypothetical protein
MTKEELIKVFSAYLPYELKVIRNGESAIEEVLGVQIHWHKNYISTEFNQYNIEDVKPILYDLSFLTKEIEHEGVWINLQKQMRHLDFEWLIGNPKLASKLNQEDYEILLKHHFNVFNLSADQFINKQL